MDKYLNTFREMISLRGLTGHCASARDVPSVMGM